MDYIILIDGPYKAFGITPQEIQQGILKIRIALNDEMIKNLSNLGFSFMEFELNCSGWNLNAILNVLQGIKKNIEKGEFKEENDEVMWINPGVCQIIDDKGTYSFKRSSELLEFISRIEKQSTMLDVLLVQVKAIVSILKENDSIEGMEGDTDKIVQYNVSLDNNIAEIAKLLNQTSKMKTYSLSKLENMLIRTMRDALKIKQCPLSPFFNTVCDHLAKVWIYIDIFATECSYRLEGEQNSLNAKISLRLFEVLTERDFYFHKFFHLKINRTDKHENISDSDREDENVEESKEKVHKDSEDEDSKENSNCSKFTEAETRFYIKTIKKEISEVSNFNYKHSREIKKLFCKISADANAILSYGSKVQNKYVLREALKVLHSKQFENKRRLNNLNNLRLKDGQFYYNELNMDEYHISKFETASSMYHKLGQHTYFNADLLFPIKIRKRNDYGSYIYFGHLYEETKQREGVGISVDCDGDIYEGCWKNDQMNGQGRHINGERGDYYIGEFKDNYFNGQGTYCWSDGRKYVGHFKEWKRYEQGTQYTKDGEIERQGDWEDEYWVGDC